ncbi:MAG: hypothetical protein INF84_06965 [Roseomonas sp.]|nr:hypothetical protein [Roseomonas sp.]
MLNVSLRAEARGNQGGQAMYSEFNSPLLGHALLGAVLAIFALGMVFWLLLAFRSVCAVVWKLSALEGALLGGLTTKAEPAPQLKTSAP